MERFADKENDFLNEYLRYKNQDKADEFYGLFLQEFRKCRQEVLENFERYIKENNISDFYNDEDRECENLRIKIIDFLNRQKII